MRPLLSRVLLVVLLAVAALFATRTQWRGASGEIVLERLRAGELARASFALEAPARVVVAAGGSVRAPGDTARAAYAWIVPREGEVPVWQQPAARPARGTYYAVTDTVALPAGTYDVYFAAIPDRDAPPDPSGLGRFVGLDRPVWFGDAGRWHVRLRAAEGGRLRRAPEVRAEAPVFWSASGRAASETEFVVSSPVRLRAEALLGGGAQPGRAVLVDMASGDTVWAFRPAAAAHAGGSARNRRARAEVALAPGVYRAAFSPGEHHPERWQGPPPHQPAHWGLRLVAAEPAALAHVHALDDEDAPLVRLAGWDCVGPSERHEARLSVTRLTPVRIVATGEFVGDTGYDYATLVRLGTDGGEETRWRQQRRGSKHAGGEDRNRRSTHAALLSPGEYAFRYVSDGSWDCSDFGSRGPTDGVWGAAIYAIGAADAGMVRVAESTPGAPTPAAAPALAAPASVDEETFEGDAPWGELLVDLTRAGQRRIVTDAFLLDRPGTVRIIALGELLPGEALDYAEIAPIGVVQPLWSMTRENTRPAGGAAKNRLFDGTLDLPAGEYVVRFMTNAAHDYYNGFDAPPPPAPWRWGIRVWRQ